MNNSQAQLLILFASLNKKEVRDLRKFIRSPFHNKRKDVVLLFEYLSKRQPRISGKELIKEKVFEFVYPKTSYNPANYYHLCFYLKRTIEKYLVFIEKQREEEFLLAKIYRKRGLNSFFENSLNKAEKQLDELSLRDANYHLKKYHLQQEQLHFIGQRNRRKTRKHIEDADELSIYFISQKLKEACHVLSQQLFVKITFEDVFLQEILKYAEIKNYHTDIPAIAVYYAYYQSFSNENSSFEKLRGLIKKYNGLFTQQEMRDIYLMPINFGIKEFNKGKKYRLREVFDLYQQGLNFGVFLDNNVLSRYTYSNINSAALGLREFDWAEIFLKKYKTKLDEKNRDNTFQYNLATLYFRKPDYARALELLQTVEFTDLIYNIESRRMLLKIYFSLNEKEALYSLLDSFKRFIYRQKDLGYHRDSFLNLIRFTNRLLALSPRDEIEKKALYVEIQNTSAIADKDWLCARVLEVS